MSTRNRERARYLLPPAALAAVLLVVGLAETTLRVLDPGLVARDPATGDDGMKFYRFHPTIGLFHKERFTGEYAGMTYTTNSRGLRDVELPLARSPGRRRIVVVGDSIVFGFGVSDTETLPDALERVLVDADVVNLGVTGFGTGQELLLLREEGLRYEPDQVILVFTLANDVEDTYFPDTADAYPANLFYLEGGDLRIDRFELSAIERLGLWLRHNSYVVARVSHAIGSRARWQGAVATDNLARLEALDVDLRPYSRLDYLDPGRAVPASRYARRGGLIRPSPLNYYKVELVKRLLLEMARDCETAGSRLAVVLAPFRAQLRPNDVLARNPLDRELARYLAENEIPVLDLLPHLRERPEAPHALYLDEMHFTAEGLRIVARLVADALVDPVRPAAR